MLLFKVTYVEVTHLINMYAFFTIFLLLFGLTVLQNCPSLMPMLFCCAGHGTEDEDAGEPPG